MQSVLSKNEVADLLNVTPRTISRYMKRGLPYLRVGRTIRFLRKDLQKFVKEHRIKERKK